MPEVSFPFVLAEWWLLSIPVLLGVFAVIIASYIVALYFGSVEEKRFSVLTELDPNTLDQNILETTTLESNVLDPTLMRSRARLETWSKVATRAYVVMVASCGALYIISRFPSLGSPFWYSLVLFGFPFVSAYFAYQVWSKVREE